VTLATAYDLLGTYPDRTRPLVTHYDGPGSRVELSVATVANAVAKAASLLWDGAGLAPGSVVSVDLPRHWQLPIWVIAGLSIGATVGREVPGPVDVRIVGPGGLRAIAEGADVGADEVLACACDAFGLPVPGGVPVGVIDVGIEVRAYPDQFSPEPAAGSVAALLVDGTAVPWATAVAQDPGPPGRGPGPAASPRLWVDESTNEGVLLAAVVLEPLLVRGSVVIGTGLAPEQVARIWAEEGVTGRAGR
jgi:uncharacterized protein (TIGR03089 family)